TIGFAVARDGAKSAQESYEKMKEKLLGELKRTFRPEFLNRVDSIVVFHSLTEEQIRQIVDIQVREVAKRLKEHNLQLELTSEARDLLAKEGYDPQYGARPLRRAIQQLLEDPLCEGLLSGQFKAGDTILIDREGDKLLLRTKKPAEVESPLPKTLPGEADQPV
ncbi:MAG: hypothetical protein QXP01_06980, partial [Candidatus Hadarchaeum sp.]